MAQSTADRLQRDIESLSERGEKLHHSMQYECATQQFEAALKKAIGAKKAGEAIKDLPNFCVEYEAWYSEAKVLVKRVLPDRLQDFVHHYESDQRRKSITYSTYRIFDFLHGITVTSPIGTVLAAPSAAVSHFRQQLSIVKACSARFRSSLFDIQGLVQGDIFGSELDAASELAKNKYFRAAGALAGVVLERHLAYVCSQHGVKITKANPGISIFNDALRDSGLIQIPQWRTNQLLGDIRNLCDHAKTNEPTADEVQDLISGTAKVLKTIS